MKKSGTLHIVSAVIDGIIVFFSYLVATYIRFEAMHAQDTLSSVWSRDYLSFAFCVSIIFLLVYSLNHLYTENYYPQLFQKLIRIILVNAFLVLAVIAFLYVTRLVDFSRLAIFLFYVISTSLLCLKYALMRRASSSYFEKSSNLKHVIVVGTDSNAAWYITRILSNKSFHTVIDGYVGEKKGPDASGQNMNFGDDANSSAFSSVPYLGTYADLNQLLSRDSILTVVISLGTDEMEAMPPILNACEKYGNKIEIIPYYSAYLSSNPSIETVDDIHLLNIREIPLDDITNAWTKRFFDIVLSLLFIIITSPIMVVTAIIIKITMPGPVFFYQERVGLNKKVFRMYKFRSMKVNNTSDTAWSTNNDDRRTPFGKFIRKCSIDELPQLFNVLKGDMSIVGPRPEIPFYVHKFQEDIPLYMIRSQVRPGMTGWAQVNGLRGDTSIEKRVKYDLYYIENWSLGFDAAIIFRTVFGGFMNKEQIK